MNIAVHRWIADRIPRYGPGARFYDTLSMERPVYRAGREAAVTLLDLQPGDRVLVIGCGTGLDFPLILDVIGPTGEIVGIDRSVAMLRQAARRVRRSGWRNVRLINIDAVDLTSVDGTFGAVMFTYSLSIIQDWRTAWASALARLQPDGKVSVVDTDLPSGRGRVFAPLAAFALFAGKVDRHRRVWRLVINQTSDHTYQRLRHGHIHVAVGAVEKQSGPATEAGSR